MDTAASLVLLLLPGVCHLMDRVHPVCACRVGLPARRLHHLLYFHVFGPALAAIIMTRITAGRAGLHELRQSIRQLTRASKVVSVHPVGHSRIGHGWDHPPAGSVGKLSRSHNQHGSRLSVLSCCHILWSRTGRRTRMAWLCIASYAKAIWFIMGNSISRRLVELLAFTRLF